MTGRKAPRERRSNVTKVVFKRITSMTQAGQSFMPPAAILPLVIEGEIIEIAHAGARIVINPNGLTVEQPDLSAKAAFSKALKTGDVIARGPNKGWIYCQGKEVEPFLVAPNDSGVMKWRRAMKHAKREGMRLPTLSELQALYDARTVGALNGTFNLNGSTSAGWYWSAAQVGYGAWCQRFSDGGRSYGNENANSSVRGVRTYTPA